MINFIINFYFLGIVILNSANSPSSESTDILPFKSWIISKAVDSPSPGFIPPLLVVKKGSKILFLISLFIPTPLSLMMISIWDTK